MERTINEIIVRAMELEVEYHENLFRARHRECIASHGLTKVERNPQSTEYEIDEAYDNLYEAEEATYKAEEKHDDILEALSHLRRASELFSGLGL